MHVVFLWVSWENNDFQSVLNLLLYGREDEGGGPRLSISGQKQFITMYGRSPRDNLGKIELPIFQKDGQPLMLSIDYLLYGRDVMTTRKTRLFIALMLVKL